MINSKQGDPGLIPDNIDFEYLRNFDRKDKTNANYFSSKKITDDEDFDCLFAEKITQTFWFRRGLFDGIKNIENDRDVSNYKYHRTRESRNF